MKIRVTLIVWLLMASSSTCLAQEALEPKPSPLSVIRMNYKDAYVKITYSQPQKKGRKIFGELVPFDQVWRTGANEATEITTTRDVMVNGQLLKAGTYSFFTIPGKEKWTIILNADLGLWGSYNYNEKLDVMRFQVPAQPTEKVIYEPFTMQFDQKNELADLLLLWDDVKVSIPLKFIN